MLRGGGVDRLAGRVAAGVPGRPRLRLQVEHGLDARHARLLRARADPPPVAPPRADVLARLRVHGELHPAAVARRGRARQGLDARQDARATAGSSSRTCARCTRSCGRTPARSSSSWATRSPRSAEWIRAALARLAPAREPRARRRAIARPRPQPPVQGAARAVAARLRGRGVLVDRAERRARPPCTRSRASATRGCRRSCASPTSRPCRGTGTASASRRAATGARC